VPSASFGEQLRHFRTRAGLSQEELAERAGLTASAIGMLERGERRRPYPHTLRQLAGALDLSDDERAALTGMTTPAVAVPTVAQPAPTAGLPGYLTTLIGRDREVAVARALLAAPATRLLTLTGPGGIGKTRLALAVADAVADGFSDGVRFVALAALRDPALVLPVLAAAFGVPEADDAAILGRLAALLGDRRVLLVLDNCEQVAAAAPRVAELLVACRGLKVLATSRAALRVRGEQAYPVPPLVLPTPGDREDVAALLETPAPALFAARAREIRPDFAITPANAATIAAICTRLDGLPLALELAAARIALLPPTALLARLEGGLGVLAGGPRDLPARQRTLRDTLAWSYDLLVPAEQALFRGLAVFAGGATLDAIEVVCAPADPSGGDLLDGLDALLHNNLLHREAARVGEDEDQRQVGDEDEPRFAMLETIRTYAAERLATSGEVAARRARHAGYSRALAGDAAVGLIGPEQVAWLARVDREWPNLRTAWHALLDAGDGDGAAELAWALWRYWWVRGRQREARRWATEALGSAATIAPRSRARLLILLGSTAWAEGDADAARSALDEGLLLSASAGGDGEQALARLVLGLLALHAGDGARASDALAESEALFRSAGVPWGIARALTYRGQVHLLAGDRDGAERCLLAALATARAAWDAVSTYHALYSLGLLSQAQGALDRAGRAFAEGALLAAMVGDVVNTGACAEGLAEVLARRDRPVSATRLFDAAAAIRRATGAASQPSSSERHLVERLLDAARADLGDAESDGARPRGGALTIERALAEVRAIAGDVAAAEG
jgi:predicted ATPase/DNA-binding XRE family transcriptional regulator